MATLRLFRYQRDETGEVPGLSHIDLSSAAPYRALWRSLSVGNPIEAVFAGFARIGHMTLLYHPTLSFENIYRKNTLFVYE